MFLFKTVEVRRIIFGLLLVVLIVSSCKTRTKFRGENKLNYKVVNNTNLFRFEFTVLNLVSQGGADSINNALSTTEGVLGYKTELEKATCLVYLDSFDRYSNALNAIRSVGYETDDLFTVAGPGVSCDIPTDAALNDTVEITSLEKSINSFKEKFNHYKNKVRIISIPNPSCLACVKGQRYVNDLFKEELNNDTSIVGLTAWISVDGWGNFNDAKKLAPEIIDERMFHFWDPEMSLGKLFKKPLNFKNEYPTAWDVYMIYEKGITWEGTHPPPPTFWMHQVKGDESGMKINNFLNKNIFTQKLKSMTIKEN